MLASAVGPGERARGITRRALAHPILTVVAAYLALRLADLVVFAALARSRGLPPPAPLVGWDAGWYVRSALEGYPDRIPTDATGTVVQSTLAWPPLYPWLGRIGAMLVPAHPASAVEAVLVAASILGGLVAAALLCLTLLPSFGASRAIGSAVLWSALPATPVLVMGYTEGLFCALAFASLWAATRQRYVLAGALLVPAGLVRVTVLPFAVALVVAMVTDRRHGAAVSLPRMATATALAALGAVAWPVILAVREGSLGAFGASQSAWGRSSIPFAESAGSLLHAWQDLTPNLVVAVLVVAAYVAAAVSVARDRTVPVAVRVLAVAAPVFVLAGGAVASTARYFVPDPALAIAIRRWVRSAGAVAVVVVLLVGLQVGWVLAYVGAAKGAPPP